MSRVLPDGAELPTAAELPDDIAALSRCQARHVRRREPVTDLERLAADLIASTPELAAAAQAMAKSGLDPREVFNWVEGDVSGLLVQARSISGGLHLHLPARGQRDEGVGHVRKLPVDTGVFVSRDDERDEGNVSNIADDVSGVAFQVRDVNGDATMNISSREPRSRPIALPVRFGQVPPLAAGFQERLVAADVSQALADEHTVVISGLGGVGKTQLAAAHAARVWNTGEVDLLIWITAVTRHQIITNFSSLAYDLTGIDDDDPERGARRLLDWLASTQCRWLVVLDDVQAPSDLDDLWPSHTSTGRVVVTTRRRDAILNGHGRRLVEVSLFTCEESLTYLERRLSSHRHLLDGADELVRALGHLPLALTQACAYMLDCGLTCTEYQNLLINQSQRTAGSMINGTAMPEEHRNILAATWSLSISLADQLAPAGLARPLLQIISLLDPNGIPITVFAEGTILRYLRSVARGRNVEQGWNTRYRFHVGTRKIDATMAREGLSCLHRLNLITVDLAAVPPNVRAHALVQTVTRDQLSKRELKRVADLTAYALQGAWPAAERDTALIQTLRNNAAQLQNYRPRRKISLRKVNESIDLLVDLPVMALMLGGAQLLSGRQRERLLRELDHEFGRDRDLHASLTGLGVDATITADVYIRVLTLYSRLLGPDHPETYFVRTRVASWWGESDPDRAVSAFADLLSDQTEALGLNHPETLATRGNLASWQGEAGLFLEAITSFGELLIDRTRLLGPEHPDTLTTSKNLAHWREVAEKVLDVEE